MEAVSTWPQLQQSSAKSSTTAERKIMNMTKKTNTEDVDSQREPKELKRKKKWKSFPISDLGFNMSLFPRPTRPEKIDPEEEERILNQIENDISDYEKTVEKYQNFDTTYTTLFEGNVCRKDKLSRKDKHRRVRKAGKQVKDKYCLSVRNNAGRKRLYIHHRLFKLINLEEKRLNLHLPSNSKFKNINALNNKDTNETKSKLKPAANANNAPVPPRAQPQNLRHALAEHNAANELSTDLISVLINIQHRELTPEDYEILLQLDDTVAPKTLDKSTLDNFKTDEVTPECAGDVCAVCMECYELGQKRKFLPCNHVFHSTCIDMWLENSSRNCPIDGLPVDERL